MNAQPIENRIDDYCTRALDLARTQLGVELDYTPASLAQVERLLALLAEERHASEEERKRFITSAGFMLGGYLGEVARRTFGGSWLESVPEKEDWGPGVVVQERCGFPMMAVMARLVKGPSHGVERFFAEWTTGLAPAAASGGPEAAALEADRFMRAMAESAVEDARKVLGRALDYTPATLGLVDELIARIRDAVAALPEERSSVRKLAGLKYGGYLGEVIRRECGGLWVQDVPGAPKGVPVLAVGREIAVTVGAVISFLEGQPVALGEGSGADCVSYFREVAARQRRWLDQRLLGPAGDRAAVEAAISDDASLAEELLGYAESALLTAETKWGVSLDFGEQSLEGLEEILAQLHELTLRPATPATPGPSPEQVQRMTLVWGTYLGELMRRQLGGRWTVAPAGAEAPVLCLEIGGARMFPLRKVQKRIVGGPADDVRFYYQATKRLLAEGEK